jgi:4-hydroxy-tetrahydrodipicolinate synthase
MKLLGRDTGELRLPMTELEESQVPLLAKTLSNYGLL